MSKICLHLLLRLFSLASLIESSGNGFGNQIHNVPFQKVVLSALFTRLQAIVHEVSDFLAVVALPSLKSCLL